MKPESVTCIVLPEEAGSQVFSDHPRGLVAGELEMVFLVHQSEAVLIPSYHQGHLLAFLGSTLASTVVCYNQLEFQNHQ